MRSNGRSPKRKRPTEQKQILPIYKFTHADTTPDVRIGLAKARHKLPDKPSHSAMHKWAMRGVKIRGDSEVRLRMPTFRLGERRYTTLAAYTWWRNMVDELSQLSARVLDEMASAAKVSA